MLSKEDKGIIRNPDFCYCGRVLRVKWGLLECDLHKSEYLQTKKRRRERIAKYSGKSSRYKGRYEDY